MHRWLVLTLAASALAQSPADAVEQQIVSELLASPEPARQAWGAHLAGNYGQVKLLDRIKPLLASPDLDVQAHALDAIIRLGDSVPAATLEVLYEKFPSQSLILLLRSAGNQPALESLLRTRISDTAWVAVNNTLLRLKSTEAITALLREFTVQLRVLVADDDAGHGFSGGSGGGTIGCGFKSARNGFPPPVYYSLTNSAELGDVVIAPGRHTVYYRRSHTPGTSSLYIDRNRLRQDYLADLLYLDPKRLPLQASATRIVGWKGEQEYRTSVAAARREMLSAFRSTAGLLAARGLIRESDAASLEPAIQLLITDIRTEPRTPLPPVD